MSGLKKFFCMGMALVLTVSAISAVCAEPIAEGAVVNQQNTVERGFEIRPLEENQYGVYDLAGKLIFTVDEEGMTSAGWFLDSNFTVHYPISDWAEASVSRAISLGILPAALRYGYDEHINREQFCELAYYTLVYAKAIEPVMEDGQKIFSDTGNEKIKALCKNGIIAGRGNGTFAPSASITREEAAKVLFQMVQKMQRSIPSFSERSGYSDEEMVAGWAVDAVKALKAMNIMQGREEMKFCPKENLTKEEAIVVLMRLI